MIGQLIGHYKILEKLSEGGMGVVYKGVDTMLDREVAIKALRPELVSQTSVVERFRSEAVTLAKLNHPNIAVLYSLVRQGEQLFMILEFVRGETLDKILQRRGVLSSAEAIPVFCQVLDGIDHAHELGIVHRDIKPANMMLTEKGILKVLDFGIARLLGSARMTRIGNIIGTLEYMSPEQIKGQETDARSDVYSLGMMLYEILTGRTPFEIENEFELMKAQTEEMPQLPRHINPDIPEEVEAAIIKAIAKSPAERFQAAGEFRETLLDAGFAASGAMRRVTGSGSVKSAARPSWQNRSAFDASEEATIKSATAPLQPEITPPEISQPAISKETVQQTAVELPEETSPETMKDSAEDALSETILASPETTSEDTQVALPEKTSKEIVKETRLGTSVLTAPDVVIASPDIADEIKETRLNQNRPATSTNFKVSDKLPVQPSFFNKLTWTHYAAGAGIFVLLILTVGVPFVFFGGEGNPPQDENGKSADTRMLPEELKPDPATMPNTPPPVQSLPTEALPQTTSPPEPVSSKTPSEDGLPRVAPKSNLPGNNKSIGQKSTKPPAKKKPNGESKAQRRLERLDKIMRESNSNFLR